jgi:hypothetical protein
MKVLRPLFLDRLEDALEKAKGKPKQLEKLLQRVRDIKVFDPSCGKRYIPSFNPTPYMLQW